MALPVESWVLDGLTLTSGTFTLMELTADPPKARMDWISAADSESAALMRQPLHENRTITMKVRVASQASMDLALDQVGSLVDKLRSASSTPDGIDLVWTPAGSTRSKTFDVLAGEITGLPISLSGDGFSWLLQRPILTLELTCKPYWTGVEWTTVTDAFGSNSIADYTFDAGAAGNVSITGGVIDAAANLTTENRLLHTASPYNVVSSQVTVKHTLGTTLTSYKAGVILKRIDASNYLEAYVDDNGTNSRLRIDRVIGASRTNLVSTNLTRMTVSTAYWVRGRIEGNVVVAEHWTSAPTVTTTAATGNTATLAGGDATTLGSGVAGRAGLVWIPQQTAAALDDLSIAPNVARAVEPFTDLEVAGVPGDIPALGRLEVTDAASQARRHVEWGIESQYYNSATSLLVDSDDMVTTGFAGAQSSATAGAYDPNASGNTSIFCTLYLGQLVAVCGTGNLSHVGSFRVKARVFTNTGTQVRISYQAGDGPLTSNPWATNNFEAQWAELDLGTITIPPVLSGTQRWTGRIDVNPVLFAGGIQVDYLVLIPVVDGYGKARATYSFLPGALVGLDQFTGTTAAASLNTRVAPLGGTWATSGDATDFTFTDDGMGAGTEQLGRPTASSTTGRFALLGSTAYTDTQVDARVSTIVNANANSASTGIVARYVDSSNYLRADMTVLVTSAIPTWTATLNLVQVLAGVASGPVALTVPYPFSGDVYRLRLLAFASGHALAQLMTDSGVLIAQAEMISSALATGGALDDGKAGLRDFQVGATSSGRFYDDVTISIPAPEPIALYSGRTIQIRYDDVIRQDSTGTYVGRPPSYNGSRFLVPVGTSRVVVKARRNDIETGVDDQVIDATLIQVHVTPRGLVIPR